MTDDELAKIRLAIHAVRQAHRHCGDPDPINLHFIWRDAERLIAEIDRLRTREQELLSTIDKLRDTAHAPFPASPRRGGAMGR